MELYRGARQLQAHVRQRTKRHSSGPSPSQEQEGHSPPLSVHRRRDAQADRRSDPTIAAAPRSRRDLHLGSVLDSNRTAPTDAGPFIETDPASFSPKNWF